MGPIETVAVYSGIIIYSLFKFVVIYHSIKNNAGNFLILMAIIPLTDFYYYFKYVKKTS